MCQCSPIAAPVPRQNARMSVHRIGEEEALRSNGLNRKKLAETSANRPSATGCAIIGADFSGHAGSNTCKDEPSGSSSTTTTSASSSGAFQDSDLINPVLEMLKQGEENLSVLKWGHREHFSRTEVLEILEILEALDINSRRIECQFGTRIAQAG